MTKQTFLAVVISAVLFAVVYAGIHNDINNPSQTEVAGPPGGFL